jgi:hypothetical protein
MPFFWTYLSAHSAYCVLQLFMQYLNVYKYILWVKVICHLLGINASRFTGRCVSVGGAKHFPTQISGSKLSFLCVGAHVIADTPQKILNTRCKIPCHFECCSPRRERLQWNNTSDKRVVTFITYCNLFLKPNIYCPTTVRYLTYVQTKYLTGNDLSCQLQQTFHCCTPCIERDIIKCK